MINTREVAKEYRISHWAQIMQERVAGGMSVREFCKHIGICENTYYYWQRRIRAAACEQLALSGIENVNTDLPVPSFTEIRVTEPTLPPTLAEARQLRIEIGSIQMTADSAYPTDKLAALLRELARPC